MENEEQLLSIKFFKTSYNKEDITNLSAFKKWKVEREKEGKKIVRCPICWGYEVFEEPTNHDCQCCGGVYCQYCLHPCVEDEVEHEHDRSCWDKFCSLVEVSMPERNELDEYECSLLLKIALIFIFGNPAMFTHRYFKFFNKNKIIDNDCVHSLFKYSNLFVNVITSCGIFYITWFELFFLIFIPSFIPFYFYIIIYNWEYIIDHLDIDQIVIFELTVRGRGYEYS